MQNAIAPSRSSTCFLDELQCNQAFPPFWYVLDDSLVRPPFLCIGPSEAIAVVIVPNLGILVSFAAVHWPP